MGFNTNLIVVTILISLAFGVFSLAIFETATQYNVTVDPELIDTFDKYRETQTSFEETQEIIQGGNINEEGQDQAVYKSVIVAAKQTQEQADIFISFLNEIPIFIKLPIFIIAMLTSIVFVYALFGFLTTITKKGP